MTSLEFENLLTESTRQSLDFARNYVVNNLPNEFRYNVKLNASTDDLSLKQFDIYPNDNKKEVNFLTSKEVVKLLNRKEKVPVWIDISVEYVHKGFTVFNLLCAGRYSNDDNEFYYTKNGTGCFGVKSPNLPIDFIEGVKFELKEKPRKLFFKWLKKLFL
jgi:hypothetical protein